MNLVGVDPLEFYEAMRAGETDSLASHLKMLPVSGRIRVHTPEIPNFVIRYPELLTRPYGTRELVAWDIAFTEFGLPKEWTPRFADEGLEGRPGQVRGITFNPKLLRSQTCRRVIEVSGRRPTISAGTLSTLKKLCGFHWAVVQRSNPCFAMQSTNSPFWLRCSISVLTASAGPLRTVSWSLVISRERLILR